METITVQCESANITPCDGDLISVELRNLNLSYVLNEVSLEKGIEALIDAHDFSQVFDAIIALQGEQDEN